jgi:hypothetical protein
VTLKFLDGGISFLEELETDEEECKYSETPDIILFLMKQFNDSKQVLSLKTLSPFSCQMTVRIPEYFKISDK